MNTINYRFNKMQNGQISEFDIQKLPPNAQFEIYARTDYESLLNFCRTGETYALQICGDDYFWKLKVEYDFGDIVDDFSNYVLGKRQELESWFEVYQDLRDKVSYELIEDVYNDYDAERMDQIRKILEMQRIKKFLDINYQLSDGTTLLLEAVGKDGYADIIAELLDLGADPLLTSAAGNVLMIASQLGNLEAVKELLKDSRVQSLINQPNDIGETPLILAARSAVSGVDVVKTLVENGADVNSADEEGYTALTHAAKNGDLETVDFLLGVEGINMNVSTFGSDYTPLLWAIARGHEDVVKKLIDAGAEQFVGGGRIDALDVADRYGNQNIIDTIIQSRGTFGRFA